MDRRIIAGGKTAVFSLVFFLIVWCRHVLTGESEPLHDHLSLLPGRITIYSIGQDQRPRFEAANIPENEIPIEVVEKADDETASPKVLATGQLEQFIQAIFNPSEQTFQRLECPEPRNLARYSTLINPPANTPTKPRRVKFFFALDLTQCVDLLPRLLGSIVETVRFLGPENCVLSIVEGNSDDGTPEVLEALRADMEALGTEYFYQTSNIASRESAGAPGQRGDRIVRLARLRNLALQPMLDDRRRHDADTTVVFLNDVAACMEDILELVYQKALLGADMTCAMDWTYVGPTPTFYDVWISRTIAGESFFRIPEPHNWDYAWNLFWNDVETQSRFQAHLPFQVFSCWNGAVAFTAEPILNGEVSFRGSKPGECYQGEPQLFCKDMWHVGHNKIAVVPSVNLEYSDARGQDIKALKGYTSTWVGPESDEKSKIDWKPNPPDQVKCMEVMGMAEWRPWNETLPAGPLHQSRPSTHLSRTTATPNHPTTG